MGHASHGGRGLSGTDLGLDGRTALVTGAGRGIGAAVATQLAAEGAGVVAASRRSMELDFMVAVATTRAALPAMLGEGGVAATVAAAQGVAAAAVVAGAEAALATGRFARPEEVANVVLLLASDTAAGNMTGTNVRIDGGLLSTVP